MNDRRFRKRITPVSYEDRESDGSRVSSFSQIAKRRHRGELLALGRNARDVDSAERDEETESENRSENFDVHIRVESVHFRVQRVLVEERFDEGGGRVGDEIEFRARAEVGF